MTAEQWCREHRKDIARFARWLLKRWSVPAGVTADDVEQELRLGAVLALRDYDESRGSMTRDKFVWWSAVSHAKRWIHTQRGALRRSGHSPSTHPVLAPVDMDEWRDVSGDTPQDTAAEFLEVLRLALAACRTERERVCLGALIDARLDVGEASGAVLRDPEMKRICNATGPRHARVLVRRSAQRLMEATWQQ